LTTVPDVRLRAKQGHELSATGLRIREAVLDLFQTRGFHAATMRDIAARAGVESSTIYYHFESKEAILFEIMVATRDDLHRSAEAVVAQAPSPTEQLRAFAANHAGFHATRSSEAAITATELHSLSPRWRDEIVTGRDDYEALLRRILDDGNAAGVFDVPDSALAGRAILSMCTGVALWYRPEGLLSAAAIAAAFGDLALNMAGVRIAGGERG
jgi:AcrR family transcriptional regulator